MPDASNSDKTIPTNLRLLLLLEEIAQIGEPMTPTAANEVLGLPKPTIHRLFHRLEEEGFLQRDIDGRSYHPGQRLRKMAVNVLSSARVRSMRLSVLNAVARDVGETCNVATPDRDGMMYLDRVETKWPLRIQMQIGSIVPFHCTASGKMYLSTLAPRMVQKFVESANLERHTPKTLTDPAALLEEIKAIREQGYSIDDEEFMEGMVAIAVPVLDDIGRLMSTLSIHAPIQRGDKEALKEHLGRLQAASKDLSELVLR